MYGSHLASGRAKSNHDIHALFVSDLHLGSRFSRADEMLQLLQRHNPEMLYLVGDIIDTRVMQRRWHWPTVYNALLNRLAELAANGTKLFYAPGNHDTFLRDVKLRPGPLEIRDSFTHECIGGRRLAVLHGDQFDEVETRARWLSHLGSLSYELLLSSDRGANRVLTQMRLPNVRFSRFLKQSTKRIVQRVSGFETRLVQFIESLGCDGLICGHIHLPTQTTIGDNLVYINLGDWIENSTGLIEWYDGRLELLDFSKHAVSNSGVLIPSGASHLSPSAARLASDFFTGWLGAAQKPSRDVQLGGSVL